VDINSENVDIIRIKVAFPIKISLAVFLIALGLDVFYYWITGSLENTLIFAGATTAASGTVLAAFYSARILSLQLLQEINLKNELAKANSLKKKQNAMLLVSRWTDPHMQNSRKTCRDVANLKGHSLDKIKELIHSEEKKTHIFHLLNFLEEIAASVEHQIVDPEVIYEFYGEIVSTVWKSLDLWIGYYREEHSLENAWTMFEKLHKSWDK